MAMIEQGDNVSQQNCHRLVVLGSPKVGKTSIVSRFLYNKFKDSYTPTIEDFHRKIYRIRGEAHRLDILDTSGNHPFPAMKRLSLITGDLFILVYSINSRESFAEVLRLKQQIVECKTQCGNDKEIAVPIVVVGNKSDRECEREIEDEEVRAELGNVANCLLLVTSAKKNVNIETLFMMLFDLARLPAEMSPSLHRKVHPSYVGNSESNSSWRGMSIRRKMSDACGSVVHARRPSIRSDLLAAQTKTGMNKLSPDEARDTKCVIQ